MRMISETEPARLAQRFAGEPSERMGGLGFPASANGLGLLVTLPVRERIADCAELNLLHAAGSTQTKSLITKSSLKLIHLKSFSL
jgi:hypothetical protein